MAFEFACGRLVRLGAVALMVVGLVLTAAPPATAQILRGRPRDAADLVKALEQAGPAGRPYLVLRDSFPEEWASFSAEALRRVSQSEPVEAYGEEFLGEVIDRRFALIRLAPPEALVRLAQAEYALLDALRGQSARSCADYAREGDMPAKDWTRPVSERYALTVAASLSAIRAAMDAPTTYAPLDKVDVGPVAMAFARHGGTTEQWDAMVQNDIKALSIDQQCKAWLAFGAALQDAPPRTAARFLAIQYEPTPDDEGPPAADPDPPLPPSTRG